MNLLDVLHKKNVQRHFSHNTSIKDLPETIADCSVGLHASRLCTPLMSIAARYSLSENVNALPKLSMLKLHKAPLMRSTLHYATSVEFDKMHIATFDSRISKRLCSFRRIGIPINEMRGYHDAIYLLSSNHGISELELKNQVSDMIRKSGNSFTRGISHVAWQIIRYFWDCDNIRMSDESAWSEKESRKFYWNSDPVAVENTFSAQCYLISRYIRQYGPVSYNDIVWWTAINSKKIKECLSELLRSKIIKITPKLNDNNYYVSSDCENVHDMFTSTSISHKPLFLAYEDPFIKAYFNTRYRYGNPYALKTLFYSTGEAQASLMLDGKIRGIWSPRKGTKPALLKVCPELSREQIKLISNCWDEHLKWLGGGDDNASSSSRIIIDNSSYIKF